MTQYQIFSITRENLSALLEENIRKRYPDFKEDHWNCFREAVILEG